MHIINEALNRGCARAALLSLAFMLLHTSAMVIAFDGLDKQQWLQWLAVPAAHLGAALLVRHHEVTSRPA